MSKHHISGRHSVVHTESRRETCAVGNKTTSERSISPELSGSVNRCEVCFEVSSRFRKASLMGVGALQEQASAASASDASRFYPARKFLTKPLAAFKSLWLDGSWFHPADEMNRF